MVFTAAGVLLFFFFFLDEEVIRLAFMHFCFKSKHLLSGNVLCLERLVSRENTPTGSCDEYNERTIDHGALPHVLHHILSSASGLQLYIL